jgi:hypothetical protein
MTVYAERVLRFYRNLPQTQPRTGPADRRLAEDLERRGIPLQLVEGALCLAVLRRLQRPPEATPLPPIRSLHYILPVLDELQEQAPLDDGYLAYLHSKLRRLTNTGS